MSLIGLIDSFGLWGSETKNMRGVSVDFESLDSLLACPFENNKTKKKIGERKK